MISAENFCPRCRASNAPNASICQNCAQPLRTDLNQDQADEIGILTPDYLLKQRYRIFAQIGQGGFGAVYKAADLHLGGRLVAIKEMSQFGLRPNERTLAINAFRHEAILLASLTHPNLPRVYEQFEEQNHWYLVMDFIEGTTLENLLETQRPQSFSLLDILQLGDQLAGVLHYLHTRQPPVIFRDLKPGNIMVTPNKHPYLIDFGIARHFKPGQLKDTVAFGSPGYAAPEQYGKAQTTSNADIYSLGATLHQLVTGNDPAENPFTFSDIETGGEPALVALDTLLKQMLSLDRTQRPASMVQIQQGLESIKDLLKNPQQAGIYSIREAPFQSANNIQIIRPNALANPQKQPFGTLIYQHTGHISAQASENAVTDLAWSPDSKQIASSGNDSTVQVWDALTGQNTGIRTVKPTQEDTENLVSCLAWSPTGSVLAGANNSKNPAIEQNPTIELWNTFTNDLIGIYSDHLQRINAIEWSPDGRWLASCSNDRSIQIHDVQTGELELVYIEQSNWWKPNQRVFQALSWSPDSRYIACKDDEGYIHILEIQTGEMVQSFHIPDTPLLRVKWSPLGDEIAVCGSYSDSNIYICESLTGKIRQIYEGHQGDYSWVVSLAWSPDGKRIASGGGGRDCRVQVWNARTGSGTQFYAGHTNDVNALAWSPDGLYLASGGDDSTVQVWKA